LQRVSIIIFTFFTHYYISNSIFIVISYLLIYFCPKVMIRDPSALPIDRGMMVAKGTSGYIKVWGDKVIPTKRLIRVKPEKRHCLYPNENTYLGRGYLRSNCLFNCYQRFMFHDCKCVPSFYYFHYEKGKKIIINQNLYYILQYTIYY